MLNESMEWVRNISYKGSRSPLLLLLLLLLLLQLLLRATDLVMEGNCDSNSSEDWSDGWLLCFMLLLITGSYKLLARSWSEWDDPFSCTAAITTAPTLFGKSPSRESRSACSLYAVHYQSFRQSSSSVN